MSTITTDPETTDHQVDDEGSADQTTSDADLSGIDETLRQAATEASAEPDDGDPAPKSLQARLRLLVPRHAVWKTASVASSIPEVVQQLAKFLAADLADAFTGHIVVWTSGDGDWQPAGLYKLVWSSCPVHKNTGEYRIMIEAPGVEVEQDHLTADQVVDLLKALRIVR